MATEGTSSYLENWQKNVDENFNHYQEQINKVTFGLQRGQAGFLGTGPWTFPYFYQTRQMRLDLLAKKQLLGRIEKEEIDTYENKMQNGNVRDALSNTFNSNWYEFFLV